MWVYIVRCLTFGVEIKLRNIWVYAWDFFSLCTVFVACMLYLVHLPPLQSLDPCILKILDARLVVSLDCE